MALPLLQILAAVLFSAVSLLLWLWRKAEQQSTALADRNRELEHQVNHQIAERQVQAIIADQQRQVVETSKSELSALKLKQEEAQVKINALMANEARLTTRLQEKEASFKDQLQQLEQNRKQLKTEFQQLATEILEQKSRTFKDTNKQSLETLLQPFRQQLDQFKKEVNDIHHRETQQQAELKNEMQSLKELNKQITQEAHELATALKGQKKMQGNWGELILDNVLERSGLQPGKDFKKQVSVKSEDGAIQLPDIVVYLPQNKHLIIDSKVSLNAYTRFVNAEDEQERQNAIKEHVSAISDRIKELADKDYARAKGLNSPEIVFMFIPIESAFVEALKADETLFQRSIEQNILVATPTTLLTSLNIVRQLWRFEEQSKHSAELAGKADAVYRKLKTFLSSFQNIKKALDKAGDEYQKAENQLVSGRGNLIRQAESFKKLAPGIQAELPADLVEKASLEVEFGAPEQKVDS